MPRFYFALAVPNVSMAESIRSWARKQSGVIDAKTEVLQDVSLSPNHYKPQRSAISQEARTATRQKLVSIADR